MFWNLFILRGHSAQVPASILSVTISRVTYFIMRAHTGTDVGRSQYRKNSGEDLEKMQVNAYGDSPFKSVCSFGSSEFIRFNE